MSRVRPLVLWRALGHVWRGPLAQGDVPLLSTGYYNKRPLHTQPSLQHLSRHARGVKVWEEASQSKAGEDFQLTTVCDAMIDNLQVNRYTKSSNMIKIFDHVATAEDMKVALNALTSFRRSLSRPTRALPLVVVRACLRAGCPHEALRLIRNKVSYGLFPSRRVFHVLMDGFVRDGDGAGAVSVYNQMLDDEVLPDGMTFHLASRAHAMLGTSEALEKAESLSRQCHELEPKLGSKSFVILVKTLLSQDKGREALSILDRLEQDQLLLPQTQLNLMTHVLVEIGELGRVLDVLREKLCVPSDDGPGLPLEAWPQLQAAVQSSSDMELRQKLEVSLKYSIC
jgi:pentatricopeptide repeat protein